MFISQVRERLRVALERCSALEEQLTMSHKEVSLRQQVGSCDLPESKTTLFPLRLTKIFKALKCTCASALQSKGRKGHSVLCLLMGLGLTKDPEDLEDVA